MKLYPAVIVLAVAFVISLGAALMTSRAPVTPPPLVSPTDHAAASMAPSSSDAAARSASSVPPTLPVATHSAGYDHAALVEALNFPSALHRRAALKALFDRTAVNEFSSALRDLQAFDGVPDAEAAQMLFRSWAEVAPEAAVRQALAGRRMDFVGAAVRAWGRKDSETAHAWVEKNLSGIEREMNLRYLDNLASTGAKSPAASPGANLAKLLSEPPFPATSAKVRAFFAGWIKQDPAAAAREVLKIPADTDRQEAAQSLIREWTARDARAALAWVNSLPDDRLQHQLQTNLILSAVNKDLPSAREFALTIKDPRTRQQAVENVATRLLQSDPEGAIALYRNELAGMDKGGPWRFFGEWLAIDLQRAGEALLQFPQIAHALNDTDDSLHATPKMFLEPLAKTNAAAAAELALKFSGGNRASAIYAVAQEWCMRDASAAGAWAAALPPGPGQDEALRQICFVWAGHDSSQVTAWLGRLPTGSGKSAAAEGFAFSVFDSDPEAAVAWLRVIPDEQDRLGRLQRAWKDWRDKNSANADDWLSKATGLTAGERAALEKASNGP